MTKHKLSEDVRTLTDALPRKVNIDRDALLADFEHDEAHEGTLGMKVLSIAGAFLATIFFMGFVVVGGLYDSPVAMGVLGALMLTVGWFLARREVGSLVAFAFAVSVTGVGFPLVLFGFGEIIQYNEVILATLGLLLSLILFAVHRHKVINFLTVVTAGGCLLFLGYDVLNSLGIHLATAAFAAGTVLWYEGEALLLKSSVFVNDRYEAVRAALPVVVLTGAYYFSYYRWYSDELPPPNWYASVVLIPLTGWVSWRLLERYVPDRAERGLYAAGVLTLLLPTFFAPAICAPILLLLLTWKVGYRTGSGLSVIALIYAVSRYYYDLNLTLLHKSVVLMVSGVLFLIAYALLRKKLDPK